MRSYRKSLGFTLVEILIALAIAGLVSGVAVGTYKYVVPKTQDSVIDTDAQRLNRGIDSLLISGSTLPPSVTPELVVAALKAVPDATLARQQLDVRLRLPDNTGISPYAVNDGSKRLLFSSGHFVVGDSGNGWRLNKSGNIPITPESRQIIGAKFATVSKWVWDYQDAVAPVVVVPTTITLDLTTSVPFIGGAYKITSPGSYAFTASTTASSGTLTLNVSATSAQQALSQGNQSITKTLTVGAGAKFTLTASAIVASPDGTAVKELVVDVNVPGVNNAAPKSLVINGPVSVSVKKSEGSVTKPYTWTLTHSDDTIEVGALSDPSQETFQWKATPGDSRVIRESQQGLSASLNVVVKYIPVHLVTVNVNVVGLGTAAVVSPSSGPEFDDGDVLTVKAFEDPNTVFTGFIGSYTTSSNPLIFTITSDVSITAVFAKKKWALNASATAGGTVAVTTPPDGSSGAGYPTFVDGTTAAMTPTAASGYVFKDYAGPNSAEVTGVPNGSILMNADKQVIAEFDMLPNSLSLSMAATLSVPVNSSATASGTWNELYFATYSTGPHTATFNWDYAKSGTTVTETVTFAKDGMTASSPVAVTYGLAGPDSLTLSMPASVNVPMSSTATATGTWDELYHGVPTSGSHAETYTWTSGTAGTTVVEPVTFTKDGLSANTNITVIYEAVPANLNTLAITLPASASVGYNSSTSLTGTWTERYNLADSTGSFPQVFTWTAAKAGQTINEPVSFSKDGLTASTSISVTYDAAPLNTLAIALPATASVAYNSSTSLTGTWTERYNLVDSTGSFTQVFTWSAPKAGQTINEPVSYSKDGLSASTSVSVTYANAAPSTVILSLSTSGGGSTSGAGTYNVGDLAQASATPPAGMKFVNWSGSVNSAANPLAITMDSDKSLVANFDYKYAALPPVTLTVQNGTPPYVTATVTVFKDGTQVGVYDVQPNVTVQIPGSWTVGSYVLRGSATDSGSPAATMTMDLSVTIIE